MSDEYKRTHLSTENFNNIPFYSLPGQMGRKRKISSAKKLNYAESKQICLIMHTY